MGSFILLELEILISSMSRSTMNIKVNMFAKKENIFTLIAKES